MKQKNSLHSNGQPTDRPTINNEHTNYSAGTNNNPFQKWMHADDVIKELRICRGTLYNWRRKRLLVASKICGRTFFEATALEDLLYKMRERW